MAKPRDEAVTSTRSLRKGVHNFKIEYGLGQSQNELNLKLSLPESRDAISFNSLVLPLS